MFHIFMVMLLDALEFHRKYCSPLKGGGHKAKSQTIKGHLTMFQHDDRSNSQSWTTVEDDTSSGEGQTYNLDGNSPSDSESSKERNSSFNCISRGINSISDLMIFKYCLANLREKAFMLSEISSFVSDEEMVGFAEQVSLYSGCYHHRRQIIVAKKLLEEGMRIWDSLSHSSNHVHWDSVVFEIEEQFMKIACCDTRSMSPQDFDLLKKVAGCHSFLSRDDFDKLWNWLYPVAFAITNKWINELWSSTSPKWIEGFITKEEAEFSLQNPNLHDPGTFILRFPTSRSWPHPDAGNLVVTYVGHDYTICHRLLSLDFLQRCGERLNRKDVLQNMLLAEPELSHLGRVIRSH